MKCPECDYENREGAKFCLECGAKLEDVCSQCGAKLPPEARFCDECGAKLAGTIAPPTKVAVPKLEDMHAQLRSLMPDTRMSEQPTGENRPVTALFADISGFTPLSNTQSSETMFQLVQDCFKKLVGIVDEYEGSISGFRGDGLLALFGAPILHENDAERAILAALDMLNIMHEQGLEVSIGINTAMMTVGEIQTQLHSEYTAYGTDINLAKRLQEAAEPGQILVGTGTHRLTRRMFDFEVLHDLSVKGFTQTVTAYSVQQVKAHPEKLRGIEGLRARMIGREHEFADLKDAADLWLQGQGQIVSIIGEAGIGKSRLVSELRAYLDAGKMPALPECLEGRCVSIGQPISYWPFVDILRTYLGLSDEDDEATRARKVTESISELMPQGADEALPLIGNLLSVRFGNDLDDRLKFAGPEQIRHQTLMRLRDIFRTLAEKQPLLLILEDLHWSDDLSLDLVSLLMDELANTPLLLLCVYRPEQEHRVWQLGAQARRKCLDRYTELILQPLSSHQSRLLVESLLEVENLPEATKEVMLTKSEGNPFFIEEVIRSLIEQDMIYHEDDHWKARDEIAHINVPDTIQSVVLARVDRLQLEAKYVLQCASVIGRLFRYRLLDHLAQHERDLEEHLSQLEERELIHEERTVPELEYAFKHAFTQEATYEGILEQRRREFHHQVAQGIEKLYQEKLEEYYEELAHHYSRSEDSEKAMEYLLKAGEKAKRNYLNEAAIFHFQQALVMFEQYGLERNDWKLEALRGLGKVYWGIGRMVEAEEAFEGAIAVAKEMELPPRQLVGLYHWIADALFWQSRFDETIRYGEMGLELLGDDTECVEAALMNTMIAMGSLNKGDNEKWQEYTRRNMEFIKELPYSSDLTLSYYFIIDIVASQDGDVESAWDWAKELEELAGQHHDLRSVAASWGRQSEILIGKGDHRKGLSLRRKSLEMYERTGDSKFVIWCHRAIAQTLLSLGDIGEAEAHARLLLELTEQVGVPRGIGLAHRLSGDIAMCQSHWEEATSHYQKCLEEFQSIGNPSTIGFGCFLLGIAYLQKGEPREALQYFQKVAAYTATLTSPPDWLLDAFSVTFSLMGITYMVLDTPEEFIEFLRSFAEQHPDALRDLPFVQWYLESAEPSTEFSYLTFADDFRTETIDPSWSWLDEFGDCSYRIVETGTGGLAICAANGRCLDWPNWSAPRLMREISGDFAVEVRISPVSDETPQIGGLLVFGDRDNFLFLDERLVTGKSSLAQHGVRLLDFGGYIDRKRQFAGSDFLSGDVDKEIHLRLERSGDEFSAYYSVDEENWLTCGTMTLPMEDPIQVGIHAIGMIDRTIYCGAYKEGTATLFRGFKLWSR